MNLVFVDSAVHLSYNQPQEFKIFMLILDGLLDFSIKHVLCVITDTGREAVDKK